MSAAALRHFDEPPLRFAAMLDDWSRCYWRIGDTGFITYVNDHAQHYFADTNTPANGLPALPQPNASRHA